MENKKKNIFREEALQNRNHHEALDNMIMIVTPLGWVVASVLSVLFFALLFWSFFGTISQKVSTDGMLLRKGGVSEIYSTGRGEVLRVIINKGDLVNSGDVIAEIEQPQLEKRIKNIEEKLTELKKNHEEVLKYGKKDFDLKINNYSGKKKNILLSIEATGKKINYIKERLENETQLLNKGLISRETLTATKQKLLDLEDLLRQKKNDLEAISISTNSTRKNFEEQRIQLEKEINENERNHNELLQQKFSSSKIVAKKSGIAVEIKIKKGDFVHEGEAVVTIESVKQENEPLSAYLYVPVADGKKILSGMEIQLTPSTIKREEDGFIYGSVESVSSLPVSKEKMERTLRNGKIVETLSRTGALFEIKAKLSNKGNGKYRWSNEKSENIDLNSGTYCTGLITVKKQAPITLLLPYFKKIFPD